ncbi:M6 family metalloprotease domain-containing protein OS=Streptomyces tendae OX=1932 GN=F3L20_29280 PE=4 SV=1 [Streptomyces tendae]
MIGSDRDVQMSEGVPTDPGYTRSTGTVRALTLMIDFSDAPGEGDALDRYGSSSRRPASGSPPAPRPPRLPPNCPSPEWLRMPRSFRQYGIERGAPFDPGYRELIRDIVAEADTEVDFQAYDLVNVLVTPNAGPAALDTVLSVTFAGNDEAPTADGRPLSNASFVYSRQDDGFRLLRPHRLPRPAPRERPRLRPARPLHRRGRRRGRPLGHHERGLGRQQRLPRLAQVEAGLAGLIQVRCVAQRGSRESFLTPLARAGGPKLIFVPLDAHSGYAVEVRTRGGNDEAVCRPGVLIYRVDADVDTGMGPIRVHDATRDSGGYRRAPNVHAELSDATFAPGQSFVDPRKGVTIKVSEKEAGGDMRIRVTRK